MIGKGLFRHLVIAAAAMSVDTALIKNKNNVLKEITVEERKRLIEKRRLNGIDSAKRARGLQEFHYPNSIIIWAINKKNADRKYGKFTK